MSSTRGGAAWVAVMTAALLTMAGLVAPTSSARALPGLLEQDRGRISGQVVRTDGLEGGTVPGAAVTLERLLEGDWASAAEAVTTDRGRYAFQGLPAGRYRVLVDHPELGAVYHPGTSDPAKARVLRVGPLAWRPGVVIRVPSWPVSDDPDPGSISGGLVSTTGEPLAGVPVRTFSGYTQTPRGVLFEDYDATETDDQGRYRLRTARPGTYRVWAGAPYTPFGCTGVLVDREGLRVSEGEDVALDLREVAEGEIAGTVTSESGVPLDFVWVDVENVELGCAERVRAEPDGGFRFPNLRAGDYRVGFTDTSGVHAEQFYPGSPDASGATPVTVAPGETRTGVDARLVPGGRVAGRVLRADGTPASGAEVFAHLSRDDRVTFATTGADGRFELTGLASDDYQLKVVVDPASDLIREGRWYTGNAVASYDWEDASRVAVRTGELVPDVEVRVDAGGTIAGTVSRSTGPAPGVAVVVFRQRRTGEWVSVASGSAGSDGRYAIGGLGAGTFRVQFGYGPFYGGTESVETARDVVVASDATVDGIDGTLPQLR